MSQSYPRKTRISGAKRYQAIFKQASRIRGNYLTLLYRPNQLAFARLGFAVSNKHSGSVVRKNQIKRQIREFFRKSLKTSPYDLVMLSKPGIEQASREQIANNLDYFRRRLNRQKQST